MGEGFRCRWVRGRLPLLAGGELAGAARRTVERHLLTCPGCRRRRESLGESLAALRSSSAAEGPAMPPLWPALARQVRESRRPASAAGAWVGFPGPLNRTPPGLRSAAAWGAVLALAVTAGWALRGWPRRSPAASAGVAAASARPPGPAVVHLDAAPDLGPEPAGDPVGEPGSFARAEPYAPPPERPRVNYDLDRGVPSPSDGREVKASY